MQSSTDGDGPMIVVEAEIVLTDPDRRDEAIAATIPYQRATRDDEPGCLRYCFAPDPVRPGVIQVYELWSDAASLAAHFEHPNYHAMRQTLGAAGLASATSRMLRVDATAPVYGPDGTAAVRFDDD